MDFSKGCDAAPRSKSWWGCSVLSGFTRSRLDYLVMNSTAYTVMHLDIEFRKHTSIEDTCFRNVPDSSNLYNAPNEELNGPVLGHAPGAVRAACGLSPFLAWLFFLLSFFIFVAEVICNLETLLDSRNTSAPAGVKPICKVHAQNHANNKHIYTVHARNHQIINCGAEADHTFLFSHLGTDILQKNKAFSLEQFPNSWDNMTIK